MNLKTLNTLEYYKITEMLYNKADSTPAKKLCSALEPKSDIKEIESLQQQTCDALTRIYRHGAPSYKGIHDIGPSLLRLEVGGVLNASELLKISSLLECALRSKNYNGETQDCLTPLFESIQPLSPLQKEIVRCIISEDEISDDASPGLKNVRRNINNTNSKIHSQLNSILNSSRSLLQDALITMRDGRYCLPVKAESKSSFPGMVHDQSSTGSTLFIEPMSVVALNNELRQLEILEKEEIEKVLATLSNMTAEELGTINSNLSVLTELDFIFARGKLAHSMKAVKPKLNTNGYINLKKARHPLIPRDKVVPIDVYIGDAFKHLIITGPNTGGKTVTLKTVGLFTLLGQSGLHIPALDNSEIAVFDNVYADIGDEQSIEQSLSTFSSHMTNIVSILKKIDVTGHNSLVLFDELGAGTDPEEGAALAMSILSDLLARGVTALATTHYSELKLYALSTENVENACCEFDVESLRPTYRLLIGIPGKSNAFAISGRLGLPEYIIKDAGSRINNEDKSFEDVISGLEESRIKMETEQKELEEAKREIQHLRKKLKEKNDRIDKAKDKIIRRANEEARDILQLAKAQADDAMKKYNKWIQSSGAGSDLEKERSMLRDEIAKKDNSLAINTKKKKNTKITPENIHIGDNVHVISLGLDGVITSLPNSKGLAGVSMGMLNSQIKISDLELLGKNSKEKEPAVKTHTYKLSKAANISTEINLIGKTVVEAIPLLDKYLDDAYLSHLAQVTVIHGRGTGALRKAVHDHLKHVSYIKSYRIGEFGEGDHGVTIVEFKS